MKPKIIRVHKFNYNRFYRADKKVWGDGVSFSAWHTYMTKNGTILINEWKWKGKELVTCATQFEVVVNGVYYNSILNNVVDLSDYKLKHIATRFLTNILNQSKLLSHGQKAHKK